MSEEMLNDFCESEFWDYNRTWNADNPDFTPCFKNTVLIWIPCLFLWILTPLEIYYLRKSNSRKIPYNLYNFLKLMIILLIIASTVSDIVNTTLFNTEVPYYIYSFGAKLITFIIAYILTWANIEMGIRSSGILLGFTFVEVIFGIPQFRTSITNLLNWRKFQDEQDYQDLSYNFYYFLIVILFVFNWFSDAKPRKNYSNENAKRCPSKNVSVVSRLFLNWFNRWVWESRKTQITHLWEVDGDSSSVRILEKVEKVGRFNIGTRGIPPIKPITPGSLLWTLAKIFYKRWLVSSFWKLLEVAMTLTIPQVLRLFLIFIMNDEPDWNGYLIAVGFMVCGMVQAIATTKFFIVKTKTEALVESALTGIIYKKTMNISNSVWRYFTTSDIVNLMSVDVNAIIECLKIVDNVWVSVVNVIVIFYCLWTILGNSIITGIIVIILLIPINSLLANKFKSNQVKEMQKKDIRSRFIQEVICSIKILKMYAWEDDFDKQAQNVRNEEVSCLKNLVLFQGLNLFMFIVSPFLLTASMFGLFVLWNPNHALNIEKAFVSVAYISVLKTAFQLLPSAAGSILRARISFNRIVEFLNSEEKNTEAVSHDRTYEAITVINGTFSWNDDDNVVLSDINMRVQPGELVAVVGPVGAGKTTLIAALLGELHKLGGTVNINRNVASYVPQQAWILNRTVRENITLGDAVDETFYQQVLDACALRQDLRIFPHGDETEIGEKGINLSGGQKQRISFARSICRNLDIYLFDDPLSAVDYHVAKHIFDNVLGSNGLLKHKTRIFVTHNITFLPQTNRVFVLKNGKIAEQGTYTELLKQNGEFSEFINTYVNENDEEKTTFSDDSPPDKMYQSKNLRKRRTSDTDETNADSKSNYKKFIDDEALECDIIKSRVYNIYGKAFGYIKIAAMCFTSLLYQLFNVAGMLWLAIWTARPFQSADESALLNNNTFYFSIFVILGMMEVLMFFLSVTTINIGVISASTTMYNKLLKQMLQWPIWLFDTTPLGRMINRFNVDIFVLDCIIASKMSPFIILFVKLIAVLLVIIIIEPMCLFAIVPILIIIYITQMFFIQPYYQLRRLCAINRSPLYSYHVETINGLSSIRAFGIQDKFFRYVHERVDSCVTSTIANIVCMRWLGIRVEILGTLITFFTTYIIITERYSLGLILIAFAMSYAVQATKEMTYGLNFLMETQSCLVSVEKIQEYVDMPIEEVELSFSEVPSNWPHSGEIVFRDYQCKYHKTSNLILKGLNFTIHSGEKIGIVGRTGAGKSSMLLALFRIIECCGGNIFIDGVDISTISLKLLRSRLTVIPQDPVLFMGTLRFNLDPTGKYSDENLWNALTKAHLKEYVQTLPGKLDYRIEEGGANFSFGQRQLLCLARALIRKTKILTLDEATASVDLATDELIQKTIRNEFAGCTVLTIAHRINTVQDYDRIMVIDDGRIVEFDSPSNLFKMQNSVFYELAREAGLV